LGSADDADQVQMALFSDGQMKWLMYFYHLMVAISIGFILYWVVGYYNVLLSEYGFSQFEWSCILSSLSAGCTISMVVPVHNFFPSDYLPCVLLVLFAILAVVQSLFISSYTVLVVCSFFDGFLFCTVNALSNAFMRRWFYFQSTSAALGVMNSTPYAMVLVTFQFEKWGLSAKTYLLVTGLVLIVAAICFWGAVTYEKSVHNRFVKEIDKFLEDSKLSADPDDGRLSIFSTDSAPQSSAVMAFKQLLKAGRVSILSSEDGRLSLNPASVLDNRLAIPGIDTRESNQPRPSLSVKWDNGRLSVAPISTPDLVARMSTRASEENNASSALSKNEQEGAPPEKLFTISFVVLLLIAAVGGLILTICSTMPFILFRENFSEGDIVLAAQVKSIAMLLGSFPVGLLVDKLGKRALVNSLLNVAAVIWWLPFITDQEWVQWPMVMFFSCIDAAWFSSLYALPLSMVAKENMGLAMVLVNGIHLKESGQNNGRNSHGGGSTLMVCSHFWLAIVFLR